MVSRALWRDVIGWLSHSFSHHLLNGCLAQVLALRRGRPRGSGRLVVGINSLNGITQPRHAVIFDPLASLVGQLYFAIVQPADQHRVAVGLQVQVLGLAADLRGEHQTDAVVGLLAIVSDALGVAAPNCQVSGDVLGCVHVISPVAPRRGWLRLSVPLTDLYVYYLIYQAMQPLKKSFFKNF